MLKGTDFSVNWELFDLVAFSLLYPLEIRTVPQTRLQENAKGDKGEREDLVNVERKKHVSWCFGEFDRPVYCFELEMCKGLITINEFISDIYLEKLTFLLWIQKSLAPNFTFH